jgi:hypothetical protein
LRDKCQSCGSFGKLFQLPGRSDCNCADCNADIAKLISLYGRLENAQPNGDHEAYLENQLIYILHRFLARSGYDPSVQFFAWPQNIAKEEHVN